MSHADVIRELTERWNAGDIERAIELYAEDAVMRTGSHWPEQATYRGRAEIRSNSEEWAALWETLRIEVDSVEEYGDKAVAVGSWQMRGAASGVGGEMPIFIAFTFRDGKIAALEWYEDHDEAVAAARDGH